MRKGFFLLAVLVAAGAAEASAQEVTARIAGLEGNAEYMEMLREEASLQAREDSVTMVVNRVRRQLRDDPAQRAVYSAEILRCEEQLFSIRTERGRLTDRINTVEQDWVLANLDLSSPSTTTAGRAAGAPLPDSLQTADLVHNAYFREQLPQADYRALLSAQRRERTAFDLAAACAANYEAIEELKISYDTITAETPAAVLYERYRTLQSLNRSLCDSLQRVWGAVYDNKNYAYAYVLDGDERHLSIRAFDKRTQRAAYEQQNGRCAVCGRAFDLSDMHADHITPWSKGGHTTPDNCQMLCRDCNLRKGAQS